MERDDLRRWQVNSANAAGGSGWWAEVSDADLASLGYVKVKPGSLCAGSGYCALSVSAREVLPEYDQEDADGL